MFCRPGFVTNSSSSDFIVALPHVPQNAEDLKGMLFGKATTFDNIYYDKLSPEGWPVAVVAEAVFRQLNGQSPQKEVDELSDVLNGGYFEEDYANSAPALHECGGDQIAWEKAWNEWSLKDRVLAEKVAKEFLVKHKDSAIYVVGFSDDDAFGSALEHGGTFYQVPHIRVNCH